MTTFLLDTSTFSLLLREDPVVKSRLASLSSEDRLAICSIVRGEIQYGLARLAAGKRKRELTA